MTSTSVVLGIAALGTAEATPDCDWATDAIGNIANRRSMNFIELSFQFSWVPVLFKEYDCALCEQKIFTPQQRT
jgi:hypothetical protein